VFADENAYVGVEPERMNYAYDEQKPLDGQPEDDDELGKVELAVFEKFRVVRGNQAGRNVNVALPSEPVLPVHPTEADNNVHVVMPEGQEPATAEVPPWTPTTDGTTPNPVSGGVPTAQELRNAEAAEFGSGEGRPATEGDAVALEVAKNTGEPPKPLSQQEEEAKPEAPKASAPKASGGRNTPAPD
jgi:hypothetical protein